MTPLKLELPSGELRRGRLTDQTYAALLDAASDSGIDSPRTALSFVDGFTYEGARNSEAHIAEMEAETRKLRLEDDSSVGSRERRANRVERGPRRRRPRRALRLHGHLDQHGSGR